MEVVTEADIKLRALYGSLTSFFVLLLFSSSQCLNNDGDLFHFSSSLQRSMHEKKGPKTWRESSCRRFIWRHILCNSVKTGHGICDGDFKTVRSGNALFL